MAIKGFMLHFSNVVFPVFMTRLRKLRLHISLL